MRGENVENGRIGAELACQRSRRAANKLRNCRVLQFFFTTTKTD
jgi:hypothetical protein